MALPSSFMNLFSLVSLALVYCLPLAIYGQQVPALFIFGDSSVDVGNNNMVSTIVRANFLPYGRDFNNHRSTGRFCNGKLTTDFLGI